MDTYERRQLIIEENEMRRSELLADIAERQARRARGEEPPEWQTPEPSKPRHMV
jgi:hypothetical protein